MSATDVYRLQRAKLIINDESLVGGEQFKLVDEKGKEINFVIPTPLGDESAYFEKTIEGGHIYTLYQIENSKDIEIEKKIVSWGECWSPELIKWNGKIYNSGVLESGTILIDAPIVQNGSYKKGTSSLTFTGGGNTSGYCTFSPPIKGKDLLKYGFKQFSARGDAGTNANTINCGGGIQLVEEKSNTVVASFNSSTKTINSYPEWGGTMFISPKADIDYIIRLYATFGGSYAGIVHCYAINFL